MGKPLTSAERHRRYYAKHREQEIRRSQKYRDEHREAYLAYQRAYDTRPERKARKMTPEARAKAAEKMRIWRAAHRDRVNETRNARYQRVRLNVLAAYGNKCACCGETEPKFLSIDHINGGGKEDREKYSHGPGVNWYNYLLREHPDHVQILCYNCNMAKGHYGACPHRTEELKREELLRASDIPN